LSLSCAEAAAAGAAWLLSDCTDTCAYAPRCLPALAELRKNLLQPPTAANSNNYTQRPTKEDAPTHTTKKEKTQTNKQTKCINENLFFFFLVLVFVFFFYPPAAAAATENTLNCTANNFQQVVWLKKQACFAGKQAQGETQREREREREREEIVEEGCLLACSFACLQGSLEILLVSILEPCMFVMWCEEHCCLLSVCAVKDL